MQLFMWAFLSVASEFLSVSVLHCTSCIVQRTEQQRHQSNRPTDNQTELREASWVYRTPASSGSVNFVWTLWIMDSVTLQKDRIPAEWFRYEPTLEETRPEVSVQMLLWPNLELDQSKAHDMSLPPNPHFFLWPAVLMFLYATSTETIPFQSASQ